MPILWPTDLIVPATVTLAPQSPSRSAGQSITGFEQINESPALRWSLKYADIFIRTRDQILAWRTIEGQLNGRAGTIRLPVYDWARSPIGARGALLSEPGRLKLAGGGMVRAKTVAITLSADASLNATVLGISWAENGAPEPGQHFSIGPNLYRVIGTAPTGPNAANLTIKPWLRASYSAGTLLDFDEPAGTFRLARDDGMTLDLETWRFAHPSVDFVEAL